MKRTRIAALACTAGFSVSLVLSGASMAMAQPAVSTPRPAAVLGHWGKAIPMPGATALTKVTTWVNAVACGQGGLCALGGEYSNDTLGDGQAFVATAHNGTWGKAIKLPGTVGVTTNGGHSEVSAVSCAPSGGYCVAGGGLATGAANGQAFVSVYKRGIWRQAVPIPGLESTVSEVLAVSCPSPGNCTVGGWFQQPTRLIQAFVADEVNGTWGSAARLPGPASTGNNSGAHVACWSAGNCTAGGAIITSGHLQALVAAEKS